MASSINASLTAGLVSTADTSGILDLQSGGTTVATISSTGLTSTSINKMAITAPATSSTLAVADGKTLTANKTLTLDGTDGTTQTFPTTSATIARTDAAQTFTGTQTCTANVLFGTYGNVCSKNDGLIAASTTKTITITGPNAGQGATALIQVGVQGFGGGGGSGRALFFYTSNGTSELARIIVASVVISSMTGNTFTIQNSNAGDIVRYTVTVIGSSHSDLGANVFTITES